MNYPKIGIVGPFYNQTIYLEETLNSLLNQQHPNLELIVIDGGSTDEIGKNGFNRKLFKKLKVFRWYQHHNISYNFSSDIWEHTS